MARTAKTVFKPARSNFPPVSIKVTKFALDGVTGVGNGIDFTDFFNSTGNNILVENTTVSAKNITIVAGDTVNCPNAGQGDYVVSIPAGESHVIQSVESARFMQNQTGSLYLEAEAGMTGFVSVVGEKRGIGA